MIIKYVNGIPDRIDETIFTDAFKLGEGKIQDKYFFELVCVASGLEPVTLAFCRGREDIEEIVYTILYKHSDNPEVRKIVRRVFGLKSDTEWKNEW